MAGSTLVVMALIPLVGMILYRFWALDYSMSAFGEEQIGDLTVGQYRTARLDCPTSFERATVTTRLRLFHSQRSCTPTSHIFHHCMRILTSKFSHLNSIQVHLQGKVAIITGANMGLGFETARQLAEHAARVVLGCRTMSKCEDARSRIIAKHSTADVSTLQLDLSEPESVEEFVKEFQSKFSSLDYLINNAGIMATAYKRNSRGWESQIATNHLGHFLLTGRLMDTLK